MENHRKNPIWLKVIAQTLHHPKWALLVVVLLTLISAYYAQQLSLRSSFTDLLPDDHPVAIQSRMLDEVVGGASFIVVAVETRDWHAAGLFIDKLREKLSGVQGIRYIDDRPPEDFLWRQGLLYFSLEDLKILSNRIRHRIERNKLARTGLMIDLDEQGDDVFDLTDMRKKYGTLIKPNSYYQNEDGTLLVSLIKPVWPTTDVERTKHLVGKIQRIINTLDPLSYDKSLSIHFTGPYVKAMRQQSILKKDAVLVSIIALLGALLYLSVHFQRKRAFFLIGLPLLINICWMLGLAYVCFGSLNLFSSVTCAVVAGLGADFGIHLYSEYMRQRGHGKSVEQALLCSIERLQRPFVVAATTTAAAFFALALSEFKAFVEFGIIAGVGVLMCAIAIVFICPLLVLLSERCWPTQVSGLKVFKSFPFSAIRSVLFSPTGTVITGIILLTLLMTFASGRLSFDYNLNHIMGSQPTKGLDKKVDGIFGRTVNPEVAFVERSEDAAPLAAALRQARDHNKVTMKGTTIADVVAYSDFIPSAQVEKMSMVGEIRNLFTTKVINAMDEKESNSYALFKKMLNPVPVTEASLPDQIVRKFRDQENIVGRMIFIFPDSHEMTQSDRLMQFIEEIREVRCEECQGPFYISGHSTAFYEIVKMLFSEGRYLMGFALIAVFLVLLLNYRSISVAFIVFTPLLVCMIAILAFMGVIGISFNIINLAALPVVLGIVTDYVIHFYQRYCDDSEHSLEEAYVVGFWPIVGSALTTLIGFGSLLFADMGGLRSFGLLMCVGVLLGIVTTLLWFPGLLAVSAKRREVGRGHVLIDAPPAGEA